MQSDFLGRILESKKEEVEAARREIPEARLQEASRKPRARRPFLDRLSVPGAHGANIVAEIKRGSPSKGLIKRDLDPVSYARSYESGGAAALSVLTDRDFFMGGPEDLERARSAVSLPVLRKDFIISTYQIHQAVVWGADAVLLIVRALPGELLHECLALCGGLQIDALVEVHSDSELESATRAGARLIGINNRDLSSFKTDIETSIRLSRHLQPDQIAVSESGIRSREDIERLLSAGIWNFLIGESLVRARDPGDLLRKLLGG